SSRHYSKKLGPDSRPNRGRRMAASETAAFRGSRPPVFGARWNHWGFRQFLAIRQPGTAAIWRRRFPIGDLFAWRHDVVPVDGSAPADGAGRSTARIGNDRTKDRSFQ